MDAARPRGAPARRARASALVAQAKATADPEPFYRNMSHELLEAGQVHS